MGSLLQLPCSAVSVWPCWTLPLIVGGSEATGTAPATTALGLELPAVEPAALVAVSSSTSVWPTSWPVSL